MNLLAPKEFLGLTEAECVRVQEELSPALEPWDRTPPGDIRSVAGVDLAYWQEGGRELAVCCIVVLDAWTGAVLEEAHCAGEVRFPYIPGCFAFRELPLVLETASRLTETFTWGTSSERELFTFTASGRAEIWAIRSSASKARTW